MDIIEGRGTGKVKVRYLADPGRNYNVLNHILIVDPKDRREKLVLSNYVGGGTGFIKIIDIQNNEYEDIDITIDLPDITEADHPGPISEGGAWALILINDKTLLVGTCPKYGYILTYDLEKRSWTHAVRDQYEQYVYSFVEGSDGMIYAGTYPGCSLLRYDNETGQMDNLGRMSKYENNMFSQYIFSINDYILVECGYGTQHVVAWDIKNKNIIEFGNTEYKVRDYNNEFICLADENGNIEFYNSKSLAKLDPGDLYMKLKSEDEYLDLSFYIGSLNVQRGYVKYLDDGRVTGVRGQDYFICDRICKRPSLVRIPGKAPVTSLLEIVSDNEGKIWGSTGFGQTIFCYDPENDSYFNTPNVCTHTGEVFGMRFINDKLFMAAYAGADHIVYDPKRPWNQYDNINPTTLQSGRPCLSRPTGKSIIGPDGAFWTGWMARYGQYGGGLSRVDPDTYEVKIWYDPVPGQSIAFGGMAADSRYIYFATSLASNGLPKKDENCFLAVWDCKQGMIEKYAFERSENPGRICIVNKHIITVLGDKLKVFDLKNKKFTYLIDLGYICSGVIKYGNETALAFCGKKILLLDPLSGNICYFAESPGDSANSYQAYNIGGCYSPDGKLYFTEGSHLYRIEVIPDRKCIMEDVVMSK